MKIWPEKQRMGFCSNFNILFCHFFFNIIKIYIK
jgi:hypothetical protein